MYSSRLTSTLASMASCEVEGGGVDDNNYSRAEAKLFRDVPVTNPDLSDAYTQQNGIIECEQSQMLDESTQTSSKTKKSKGVSNPASITPTVILNGLAMARGEKVSYLVINKTPLPSRLIYEIKKVPSPISSDTPQSQCGCNAGASHLQLLSNHMPVNVVKRWIYPYVFHVQVTVGDRTFDGEGKSQQAARHNAATNALEVLQAMPIPKHSSKKDISNGTNSNKTTAAAPKSKISVLYEKASASRVKIKFEVVSETGPPHLRVFQMGVVISKSTSEVVLAAEGTGSNKNIAKTKAAEAALEIIQENPLPPRKSGAKKKEPNLKLMNVLSVNKTLHPSSRLSQIMQAKHKSVPTYKVISSDTKNPHYSSYAVECSVEEHTTTGHGKSKKDAKRDASEKMLTKLGFKFASADADQASVALPSKTVPKGPIKARAKGDVFLTIRRQKTTIFTDAKESMLVSELKRVIEGILKIAPEDQMLYAYKDDQPSSSALEDNKTLADSGFTSQTAKAQTPGILGLAVRDGENFEPLTIEKYSTPPELPDVMKTHDGIGEQKK